MVFYCPEWRKTIKACGKNRENKLKAERRNKTWRMHGDVTLTNETVKFNYDRGRKFTVDAMAAEASMARYQIQYRMEFFQTR